MRQAVVFLSLHRRRRPLGRLQRREERFMRSALEPGGRSAREAKAEDAGVGVMASSGLEGAELTAVEEGAGISRTSPCTESTNTR